MRRIRMSRGAVAAALALVLSIVWMAACGDDRDGGFLRRDSSFETDASTSVDAPDCRLQCSLDGRSLVEDCTGKVVETCRPELACGGGVCQEPCAAAAADRSSNGCEFYLQVPPSSNQFSPASCYAAYVVNTSNQPADVSFELEGRGLDISKSMYRTNPGDAALTPHVGAIPPGESVVLFISDSDPNSPPASSPTAHPVRCPDGIVPTRVSSRVLSGTTFASSYHLRTNVPVAASTIYPFGGARSYVPTATLLLPVATWGKQHILVNAWELGRGPSAQIIASEDDTEVTIVPTRDIQDGNGVVGGPAQVPITYRLDKGQLLQLVQPQELTGSMVASSKPITTVGGNVLACIPWDHGACDIAAQQIPAFEQWGSEYVGVGYRPRAGNEHESMPY
ncbi:MAG: IgGFc-binding protein, partial [Myxococcales bacterium]|nr:IgGFc-binding protein [Myxococcales bacterium]